MSFQNQNIWITGASSGIGEGLVRALAPKGANLLLSARRKDRLNAIAADCRQYGTRIEVLPMDLTDTESINPSTQKALMLFNHIDILVLCAGVAQRSLIKETITQVDRDIMALNYFGTVDLTRSLLPSMLARKSGHLVVISSLAGKFSTPSRSSYAASKHALHGYFDSLRAETFKEGINVSLVCPGYIQTEIMLNAFVGDGGRYGKVGEANKIGMPVAQCAERIIKGIVRKEEEFVVSEGKEKYALYLKRFFPKIFSRVVRNVASE